MNGLSSKGEWTKIQIRPEIKSIEEISLFNFTK